MGDYHDNLPISQSLDLFLARVQQMLLVNGIKGKHVVEEGELGQGWYEEAEAGAEGVVDGLEGGGELGFFGGGEVDEAVGGGDVVLVAVVVGEADTGGGGDGVAVGLQGNGRFLISRH